MSKDAPTGRRVVADENQLRTALRQQLKHNEQQNLAMTQMSRTVGRAGRLVADIQKLINKTDNATMTRNVFFEETAQLISKFEATGARGTKSNAKRS